MVVEYVDDEPVVTPTSAVTNHNLSPGPKYGVGNEESHHRFGRLAAMQSGISTPDQMTDAVAQVSYPGLTRWIIPLAATLDFYWDCRFHDPHRFQLR